MGNRAVVICLVVAIASASYLIFVRGKSKLVESSTTVIRQEVKSNGRVVTSEKQVRSNVADLMFSQKSQIWSADRRITILYSLERRDYSIYTYTTTLDGLAPSGSRGESYEIKSGGIFREDHLTHPLAVPETGETVSLGDFEYTWIKNTVIASRNFGPCLKVVDKMVPELPRKEIYCKGFGLVSMDNGRDHLEIRFDSPSSKTPSVVEVLSDNSLPAVAVYQTDNTIWLISKDTNEDLAKMREFKSGSDFQISGLSAASLCLYFKGDKIPLNFSDIHLVTIMPNGNAVKINGSRDWVRKLCNLKPQVLGEVIAGAAELVNASSLPVGAPPERM